MSCTELYRINKKGDVSLYETFGNSHFGAMTLWSKIFEQYKEVYFPEEQYLHALLGGDNQSDFWNLYKKKEFPEFLSILLLNSYDKVMIKREDFPILIKALKEFDRLFIEENTNDHYLAYIDSLEKLSKDRYCIGICWNQTSINCNPWNIYKDEDSETGEMLEIEDIVDRDYNIFQDEELGQYFLDLKNPKKDIY